MASMFSDELDNTAHENELFPTFYPDNPSICLYDPIYQAIFMDQNLVLPAQHPTLWDIPETFYQNPLLSPTTTSNTSTPTPPPITDVDFSHVILPLVEPPIVPPQVSPSTVHAVEAFA